MQLIHVGYGSIVNADRVIAILNAESAPIKRQFGGQGQRTSHRRHIRPKNQVRSCNGQRTSSAVWDSVGNGCVQSQGSGRRGGYERGGHMKKQGVLIVISGFSGAGKGTVVHQLMSDSGCRLSISATTRAPRTGEEEGREYFFLTKEEFQKRIEEGRFLEWAEFCGNFYGTPKDFVLEQISAAGSDS